MIRASVGRCIGASLACAAPLNAQFIQPEDRTLITDFSYVTALYTMVSGCL